MASDTAAIWSAIAATFSAITAWIVMRLQRKSLLDNSKPEIVIEGWKRFTKQHAGNKYDVLSFEKISNAGKGSALRVYINTNEEEMIQDEAPSTSMSTVQIPIIPAGKSVDIKSEINLFWQNAKFFGEKNKYIPVSIKIYSWCVNQYRHETNYSLMVFDINNPPVFGGDQLAQGVNMGSRRTISQPVWKLKTLAYFAKMYKKIKLLLKKKLF